MVVSAQTLADALLGNSDAPAIFPVGAGYQVTRGQLREAVFALAKTLQQSGIRKGDVVSIAEANTVCSHAGKVLQARAVSSPDERLLNQLWLLAPRSLHLQ